MFRSRNTSLRMLTSYGQAPFERALYKCIYLGVCRVYRFTSPPSTHYYQNPWSVEPLYVGRSADWRVSNIGPDGFALSSSTQSIKYGDEGFWTRGQVLRINIQSSVPVCGLLRLYVHIALVVYSSY